MSDSLLNTSKLKKYLTPKGSSEKKSFPIPVSEQSRIDQITHELHHLNLSMAAPKPFRMESSTYGTARHTRLEIYINEPEMAKEITEVLDHWWAEKMIAENADNALKKQSLLKELEQIFNTKYRYLIPNKKC